MTETPGHPEIHRVILRSLREDLIGIYPNLDNSKDHTLLKTLFRNYRWSSLSGVSQGIRLSVVGNQLMQKHYESHSYHYQGKRNHSVIIALDKNMMWPYYIGTGIITLYNQQDAAWFQLNGNDIEHFVSFI